MHRNELHEGTGSGLSTAALALLYSSMRIATWINKAIPGRVLALGAVAGFGVASVGCDGRGEWDLRSSGPRHVILISVDTLRADHLGCYGNDWIESPVIDELAAQGVLFENCSSTASTTLASHTSIMTGTYPHRHGAPRNGFLVDEGNLMLAELLGRAGFFSAGFVGAIPLDASVGFPQGFRVYDAPSFDQVHRSADDVNSQVFAWLKEWQGAQSNSQELGRLFLFVHYYDVHAPYNQPAPFKGMYRGEDPVSDKDRKSARNLLILRDWMQGVEEQAAKGGPSLPAAMKELESASASDPEMAFLLSAEGRDELEANFARAELAAAEIARDYAAGVSYCDNRIGQLLQALESAGILDQSLVVLTADHGEILVGRKEYFSHGKTVYQEEVHVPLIMRLPTATGDVPAGGRRVSAVVSGVDIAPTILDALGLEQVPGMQGRSLSAALDGSELEARAAFSEATKPRFPIDPKVADWPNNANFQSVRLGNLKLLVKSMNGFRALYDLNRDPGELENLFAASSAQQSDHVHELESILEAWRDGAEFPAIREVEAEGLSIGLEALGYVDED